MTDFRDDIERISKRRLTGKENAILIALVLIIGSTAGYFCLPAMKNPESQPPVPTQVVNPEGAAEPPPNLLERFNEELQSLNHPLRKLIEEGLGIDLPNRTVKRSGLALTALDPQGKAVAVRWDEYQYKKWGGFFFRESRNVTLKTVLFDKRWIIVSCVDDHTGERVGAYAGAPISSAPVDYVRICIWNDETQQFSEFDESVCRFDAGRKNVVIIHGMGGNTSTTWIQKVAQRIRTCEPETNIIGVDWSYLCETLLKPITAAKQIPDIVKQADSHLFGTDSLNLALSKTHVIGFSHGSHIAGLLGMKHIGEIGRLTALDPSTRIVHVNWENIFGTGWGRSAAKFVDMYASSTWAGTQKRYGHKTYFAAEKNEKILPNFNPVDSHNYAAKWFLSTIGNNDTRFGYSIDVTQNPDSEWSGKIRSSLPQKGELDGVDDEISNEIEKSPQI